MRKKKFITIFPNGKNIHLVKDVGMIPYMLHKEGFYDSTIAFYENENELPYLKTEVNGLQYKRVKKKFKHEDLNIFFFSLTHLFEYDVIMTFHPHIKKVLLLILIKFLSFGKIKLYCKLDESDNIFLQKYNKKSFAFKFKKVVFSYIDLISSESTLINNYINKESFMKTKCIPNGFVEKNYENNIKENIILTVGRIGTIQKDNCTLLKALSDVNLKNWNVIIAGPIEKNFYKDIDDFYKSNPNLKSKVRFLGNISDRNELDNIYAKAKIFVLTSLWEGFPLVFPEAIANGCYVISTNLSPAFDITDNEKFGKVFPIGDYKKLSLIFQDIIDCKILIPESNEIKKFANKNFNWKSIVSNIYKELEI